MAMADKIVGDYTLMQKIGKGGQATVWKARDLRGGLVAIKKMSVGSNEDNTKSYEREVAITKLVHHPYMIKSIASFKDGDKFYLVYEFCPTDLLSFLQKQPGSRFSEAVCKRWIYQLTDVMTFLNKHRIIHRDLKPDNILLTTEHEDAEIRLADFGLARQGLTTRSFVGTLEYASPEIKNCQEYSYNTDVWSLGVIFFAIVFGKLPVFMNRKLVFPSNPVEISQETKRFIENCLVFDQNRRPNFEDLLKDNYFREIIEERKENPIIVNEKDRMNELMNQVSRISIRPSSIIPDRADHPIIVENPNERIERVDYEIQPEIIQNPQKSMHFPEDRREIEQLVLKVFFLSDDVMSFVETLNAQLNFLIFFTAQYFTDQFKFILENLMQSRHSNLFGAEFFELFFSKSEKITNICNHLEIKYKDYTNDQFLAASWQIDEIIDSNRNTVPEHVLKILQEISQKLSSSGQSN